MEAFIDTTISPSEVGVSVNVRVSVPLQEDELNGFPVAIALAVVRLAEPLAPPPVALTDADTVPPYPYSPL